MRHFLAALLVLLPALVRADAPGVGRTLHPIDFEDQHGAAAKIDEGTRIVVLTEDMTGGGILKEAFAGIDQQFLDARHAVYVADVSGMPAIISRVFAIPRMRARSYRVLLDPDGAASHELPHTAGKVTIVFLDALRVTRVVEAASAAEVRAALE
jgi:hypothetical protein